MTDNLDSIAEQARLNLAAKDTAREKALPLCRETIRHCSQAIRAIHRQEFQQAETLLQTAHNLLGEVEESNLIENKVYSWRIRIAGSMGNFLGGARGVIIPHQFVKAVGDIVVVSRASLPLDEGDETVEETVDLSDGESTPETPSIM